MSDNPRELYALTSGNFASPDSRNRFQNANHPVKLTDDSHPEKWTGQAREPASNRTEARDEFGQHMEAVRRRTEEEFRRNGEAYTGDRLVPTKLSQHRRRKHLHLYSNKPGSGQSSQGTAVTRNRSEPHGIDLQSARARQIRERRAVENQEIEPEPEGMVQEQRITKTYRYDTQGSVEVEEIEEIGYRAASGGHSLSGTTTEKGRRNAPPKKAVEYREDLVLEEQRSTHSRYKEARSRSKRNSQRIERADNLPPESIFRKLHEKAQNLYSNLNGNTTDQLYEEIAIDRNYGNTSDTPNQTSNKNELYVNPNAIRNVETVAQQRLTQLPRTEAPAVYVPEGQRLIDEKLEEIRRRNRQIQQEIDARIVTEANNMQSARPFQNTQLAASGNYEVNRSLDVRASVTPNFQNGSTTNRREFNGMQQGGGEKNVRASEAQQFQEVARQTFGRTGRTENSHFRGQGITVTQNKPSGSQVQEPQQTDPRTNSPQFRGATPALQQAPQMKLPPPQTDRQAPLPEALQQIRNEQNKFAELINCETLPEVLQEIRKDSGRLNEVIINNAGHQKTQGQNQSSQKREMPEVMQRIVNDQKRFNEVIVAQTSRERPPESQARQVGVAPEQITQKQMPEFMNQLRQQTKQLNEVIAGRRTAAPPVQTRTQPFRQPLDSEGSENETPKIDSNKNYNRIQQGRQLVNIIEGRSHSNGHSIDEDLAAGSIIDDLGKGGNSGMQPQSPIAYKHSEFRNYPEKPNSAQLQQTQLIPLQQPPQRTNVHMPIPVNAQKTVTLGPISGVPSAISNVNPVVQVQHSQSQPPVGVSEMAPQPVFYSPPHAQNPTTLQNKVLNGKMVDLLQTASQYTPAPTQITTIRTGSGHAVLPHELPESTKNLPPSTLKIPQVPGNVPPSLNNIGGVPGQILGPPTVSTSRVLLPGGMQQTTTTTTTQQLVQLGPGVMPGQTLTTQIRRSQIGAPMHPPYAEQMIPDTERRLVDPSGMPLPVTMSSQLPNQVYSSNTIATSKLPTVVGTSKKKGTCLNCCRCSIF